MPAMPTRSTFLIHLGKFYKYPKKISYVKLMCDVRGNLYGTITPEGLILVLPIGNIE